jgi:hypothetical protein
MIVEEQLQQRGIELHFLRAHRLRQFFCGFDWNLLSGLLFTL